MTIEAAREVRRPAFEMNLLINATRYGIAQVQASGRVHNDDY